MIHGASLRAVCVFLVLLFLVPKTTHATSAIAWATPQLSVVNADVAYYGYEGDAFSYVPTPIDGAHVNSPSPSWQIHFISTSALPVPAERGVYVMYHHSNNLYADFPYGDPPVLGQNIFLVHAPIPEGDATTTITFEGMSPFGSSGAGGGLYDLFVFEIPESVTLYDPDTDQEYQHQYTDQDLLDWMQYMFSDVQTGVSEHASQYMPPVMWDFQIDYTAGTAPAHYATCCSSVAFLPGIEGSRLYRPGALEEDRLWEPDNMLGEDIPDLYLAGNDARVSDVYAKQGDVIDSTPTGDIYKPFIDKMNALKNAHTIADWEPLAYDWRLSLDDILTKGNNFGGHVYYRGVYAATTSPYIVTEIRRLAATSQTGKVTIVAHSNGGLVAKRLTQLLGDEAPTLIDKIILVASPQAGAPEAIVSALHGKQDFGWFMPLYQGRIFAHDAPMMYHLLPSNGYITQVDDPLITIDDTLPGWQKQFGSVIHSTSGLDAFLTDTLDRVSYATTSLSKPTYLRQDLIDYGNLTHTNLDTWTPPAGIEVIQIAGWGIPSTISGISYSAKKDGSLKLDLNTTVDGDGTVPVPSALWVSTTTGARDYWVNLDKYSTDNKKTGDAAFDHSKIFAVSTVNDFVADIVASTTKSLSSYTYLTDSSPESTSTRLHFALHSPLTLDLYDDLGRHTGVSTTTGEIEQQIPGTYFIQVGDTKYIFADEGVAQHIVMSGYDTGTFTFEVGQFQGDTEIKKITFQDVPTTPDTKVHLDIPSGIDSVSNLSVDENGDGSQDMQYASSTGTLVPPSAPIPVPPPSGGGNGSPFIFTAPTTTPHLPRMATTTPTSTPQIIKKIEQILAPATSTKPAHVQTKQKPKPTISTKPSRLVPGNARLVAGAGFASTSTGMYSQKHTLGSSISNFIQLIIRRFSNPFP